MRTITANEFRRELDAQGVIRREDFAFKCPVCHTVQSMQSLISAGVSPEQAESKIGFSCIGRVTGAGPFRKGNSSSKGCDWTLGGLFKLHELEVIDSEGKTHPMFEIATAEEAMSLANDPDRARDEASALIREAEAATKAPPPCGEGLGRGNP